MKHLGVYIIAILVLMSAVAAWSQSDTPETPAKSSLPDTRSVTGRVVESTDTYLTIRTASGEQIAFAVDGQSKLPPGLLANRMVTVQYQVLSDGTSRTIVVTPASEPTGSAASAATPTTREAAPVEAADEREMVETSSLPQTASIVPAIGLAGLLFLAFGLVVSSRRRHRPNA